MAYTTINKGSSYMDTSIWSGNGSTSDRNITSGVNGGDLVWTKRRNNTYPHILFDSVRTFLGTKGISSQDTSAEGTVASEGNGFIGGTGDSFITLKEGTGDIAYTNATGGDYVAWNWKANGAGSANTDGDINSTVSVNTTAGFSIVKYTGNATADQSIGHGLGVTPKMIIIKNLDATASWMVYHHSLGYNSGTIPRFLQLDNTNAQNNGGTNDFPAPPTSSVFKVGSYSTMNGSGNDIIAYCFEEVAGYSKFGSYTGNSNADGTFVYTGFKPSWVMLKRTDSTSNWTVYDNKRLGYNVDNNGILANTSDAEYTDDRIDLLSNGFKLRANHAEVNTGTYIYMAFGQTLVGTNNIPGNAR